MVLLYYYYTFNEGKQTVCIGYYYLLLLSFIYRIPNTLGFIKACIVSIS
jgi:hypothetical protein